MQVNGTSRYSNRDGHYSCPGSVHRDGNVVDCDWNKYTGYSYCKCEPGFGENLAYRQISCRPCPVGQFADLAGKPVSPVCRRLLCR
jgi:hypothetical protein